MTPIVDTSPQSVTHRFNQELIIDGDKVSTGDAYLVNYSGDVVGVKHRADTDLRGCQIVTIDNLTAWTCQVTDEKSLKKPIKHSKSLGIKEKPRRGKWFLKMRISDEDYR